MRARLAMIATLLAAAAVACADVPDVVFDEQVDRSAVPSANDPLDRSDASASHPVPDASRAEAASAPPAHDAATTDDATHATADAEPPPTGCPFTVPAGADSCCGAVPCVGKKCDTRCGDCAGCNFGACCVPNGNGKAVTCATSTGACGKDD